MKGIKVYHYAPSYDDCFMIIHYNFTQMLNIAINIYFILPFYVGVMLNAFNDPLHSKLCWHNRWVPTKDSSEMFA